LRHGVNHSTLNLMATESDTSLEGQLLLALPGIGDPRFERTVIYMCQHSADSAMGLVINRAMPRLHLGDLLEQLKIPVEGPVAKKPVLAGGPVETGRGFVLHTADYQQDSTLQISEDVSLTATVDILKQIAGSKGPERALVALGYAGWGPGQLDTELTRHGWLTAPASMKVIFDTPLDQKWTGALATLGIDVSMLANETGHA
jgi:putative transcriptional regulator